MDFPDFLSDRFMDYELETTYGDDEVFKKLIDSYRAENRKEFESKEEADLFTETQLSPFREANNLAELRVLADEQAITIQPPVVDVEDRDSAFGFSIDQAQKMFGAGIQTLGDLFDSQGLRRWGAEYVQKQIRDIEEGGYQRTYNKSITETLSEDGLFAGLGAIGERIAESWATTGAALLGGVAAVAAAPVSAGAAVGATVATAGFTGLQGIGELREELEEKGVYDPDDAELVAGVGAIIGLVDAIAGRGVAKVPVLRDAIESGLAKQIGSKLAGEATTEAVQEASIIGTAVLQGAEYEESEVVNRLIDSAIVGGAMGGATASATNIPARLFRGERDDVPPPKEDVVADDVEQQDIVQEDEVIDEAAEIEEAVQEEAEAVVAQEEVAAEEVVEPEEEIDIAEEVVAESEQDPTVRARLSQIFNARRAAVDIDVDAVRSEVESSGAAPSYQERFQTNKGEYFADSKTHDERVAQADEALQQEINALLNDADLEVQVNASVADRSVLRSDIAGRGIVRVDKQGREGTLGAEMSEGITYREALQAIKEAYGRFLSGAAFSKDDENHVIRAVASLFSEQARPAALRELLGAKPNVLVNEVAVRYESPEAFVGEQFFASGKSEQGRERAQTQLTDADLHAMRHRPQLGARVAKAIDVVFPDKPGRDPSRTVERVKKFLRHDVLNERHPVLNKMLREQASEEGTLQQNLSALDKQYKNALKRATKNLPSGVSKKAYRAEARDMYLALMDGTLRVRTQRAGDIPTAANMVVEDGRVVLEHQDGVTLRYMPVELMEPHTTFVVLAAQERRIILEQLSAEINANEEKIRASVDAVHELRDRLRESLADQDEITVDGFGAKGTDWRNNLFAEKVPKNFIVLREMMDYALGDIATAKHGDDMARVDLEVSRLRQKLFDAMDAAEGKPDAAWAAFFANTDGEFGDSVQDFDPTLALAIGAYGTKGQKIALAKELHAELKLQRQHDMKTALAEKIKTDRAYYARTYKAHKDPKWVQGMARPRTKEQKNARKNYTDELKQAYIEANTTEDYTPSDTEAAAWAEAQVREFVAGVRDVGKTGLGESGHARFVMDTHTLSALSKRGKHSAAFDKFMGRETDPDVIARDTVQRMADYNFRASMVKDVFARFNQNGLYTREEYEALSAEQRVDLVQHEMADPENLFRKAKVWVDPTLKTALDAYAPPVVDGGFMGFLQQFSALWRGMTAFRSIPVAAQNIWSGHATMLAAGVPGNFRRSPEHDPVVRKAVSGLIDVFVNKRPLAELDPEVGRAIFGSIGGAVDAGSLRRDRAMSDPIVNQVFQHFAKLTPKGADIAEGAWRAHDDFFMNFHQFGDLMYKTVSHIQRERDMLAAFQPSIERGVYTKEAVMELAKDFSRTATFDLHDVPRVVKVLRERVPLGGAFLNYDTLMLVSNYKAFEAIARIREMEAVQYGEKNIDGFDFNNDEHLKQAKRSLGFGYSGKLMGYQIAALSMQSVLSRAVMAAVAMGAFGDEDEPVEHAEAMRVLMPDYYQNSNITVLSKDAKGRTNWMDVARLSNNGKFVEGAHALLNNIDSPAEAAWAGLEAMFGGYFAEGWGPKTLIELRNNRSQFNQQIYDVEDNIISQAADMAQYIATGLAGNASFVKVPSGLWSLAADNANPYTGEESSAKKMMLDHLGFRVRKFDPVRQFQNRAWSLDRRVRDSRSFGRSLLKSYNKRSDGEIRNAVLQMKDVHEDAMSEWLETIEAGRTLGLSDDDMIAALKEARLLNKASRAALFSGQIPAFDLKSFGASTVKGAKRKRVGEEQKDNFEYNFKKALDIGNNL